MVLELPIGFHARAGIVRFSRLFPLASLGIVSSRVLLGLCCSLVHNSLEKQMRNALTILGLALAIALSGVLLTSTLILSTSSPAWAQGQPTSCSEGAQMCKEAIGRARDATRLKTGASGCDAAAAECMKTGVFVGPASGIRWPVAKK